VGICSRNEKKKNLSKFSFLLERGRSWLSYVLRGLDTHAIVCSAYAISTDMKRVLKLVFRYLAKEALQDAEHVLQVGSTMQNMYCRLVWQLQDAEHVLQVGPMM
jgi:hypothetical protein